MRLKGFQKLTSINQAMAKFFEAIKFPKLQTAVVSIDSALNRVLAEKIIAEQDVPGFNRSAVDGFAVNAAETIGATQFKPKVFQLTLYNGTGNGKAKQIWTGNPLPAATDAVVMLEDTKLIRDRIDVWSQVTPGENVSKKGEDIQKGATAVEMGKRLKPQHVGLISALGIGSVKVFQKPRIAVLNTGNELKRLDEEREENQIFDTNSHVLRALCMELGAEPIDLGTARDKVNEISEKLRLGLRKADAIITSGGTSVGGLDLVPDAVNNIGNPGVIVHGVAMRPGMPTALANVEGKPILILPGNPVAVMVAFEVFARPLICRLLGMKQVEPRPVVQAKMTRGIATALGRRSYVRVRVFKRDDQLFADPISAKGSSMISTMTRANGYVAVSENREGLEEKEPVMVQLFDIVEG